MRMLIAGIAVGFVLAALLSSWVPPAEAQGVRRIFGTRSNGAQIALQATDAGELKVSCQ